jgi:hypothetical protein
MKRFARGMVAGLLVGLPLLMSPLARADFVPSLDTATSTSTSFVYTANFNNTLSASPAGPALQLSPYAGTFTPVGPAPPSLATVPGQFPTPAGATGSFLTIYDIPNISMVAVNPIFASIFRVSTQALGLTSQQPAGAPPNPTDSPALTNVTLIYTGPTITSITGATFADVLTITTSAPAGVNPNGVQTNQVGSFTGTALPPNTPITAQGPVGIPGAGAVPEPASVVMMSFGGLGVGALALFYRRKASA